MTWKVDTELELALWRPMRELALEAAKKAGRGRILDIGGGGGAFTKYISEGVPGFSPVSIDIVPAKPCDGVDFVLGDALRLPFGDESFDMLAARAVLHHFPENLPMALKEAHRVLKPGGSFVIEEPCAGNPMAALARNAMPTDRHDPGERPMTSEFMLAAIARQFTVAESRHFFLTSYLAPHLGSRLPSSMRPAARKIGLAAARFDERLLSGGGYAKRFAAYVHILAIKSK